LIYPLERLKAQGFSIVGLFYNPNVHPAGEHERRKQAVFDLSRDRATAVIYPDYTPAEFFWEVHTKEEDPKRCSLCWRLRLKKTAQTAKGLGFGYFSSTLLVSPYQDQELLKSIGNAVAKEEGLEFYYEDFRPGFREAHDKAKRAGVYCQKYCGCVYSELERHEKKGQSPAKNHAKTSTGTVPAKE
jgi:predicted adenine nucleotide alpha hydrolase (AANH) superfamily ATPase